jgi:hypothetical protein
MPVEFEDLLDCCLAKRAEGRSAESSVADVDEQARGELEALVLLVDGLREVPRPGLSAAASAFHERRLLTHTARLRSQQRTVRRQTPFRGRPWVWLGSRRFGFAPAATILVLLVAAVLFAGAGSMVANARSDETLYNVKLSWEQARLLLSANDARRARVFVDLAQNRVAEIEALAAEGRPIPEELLSQVRAYVDEAINLSTSLSGRDAISLLRAVAELLSYERMLLLQVLGAVPPEDLVVVERALESVEASQQAATQALQDRVDEQLPGTPTSFAPAHGLAESAESSHESSRPEAPPERSSSPGSVSLSPAATVRQAAPIEPLAGPELGGTTDQGMAHGRGIGLQSLREGKHSPNEHKESQRAAEHGRSTEPEMDNRGNPNKPSAQEHGPPGGKPEGVGQPPLKKEVPASSKQPDAGEPGAGGSKASNRSTGPSSDTSRSQGGGNSRAGRAAEGEQNPGGNKPPQAPGKPAIQPGLR